MYKIINYHTGETIFGDIKTRAEAEQIRDSFHRKSVEDEEMIHCWGALIYKQ